VKRSNFLKNAAFVGAGAAATGSGLAGFRPMMEAAAAAGGRSLGSLKFSFIVKTVASTYWTYCIAGGKKGAADLGVKGLAFTGGPSEADFAAQTRLIEDAIAQKPDFLIIAPVDKTSQTAPITKAYNAGIKVILIDSDANAPRTAFLSTDNVAGGTACADALAAAIKAKTGAASGQIAYATFQSNVGSLTARDSGFLAGIKKYPGLKIVANKNALGDPSLVKEAAIAADTLTAFPNLVGYWGDNLQCVEGAAKAFADKKVSMKKVSLGGFDSDPVLVADLASGAIDFTLLQDPFMMGYGGVWYGLMAALGVKVPVFVDTGANLATAGNMNSPLVKGLLDPTGTPGRGATLGL
jgi:ribose transport system substrate-binding protein